MRVGGWRALSGCTLAVAMRLASSELPSRRASGVFRVEMPQETEGGGDRVCGGCWVVTSRH